MSFGFGFSLPAYAGYAASFGPSSFGAGTSLALDFLNGNNTLDPRITFSRTSNATLTNSAGVLTYAPHNLLTFSEQFDNAAWTKGTSTITANAEFAPNGTNTADFLKEDASPSSFHSCFRAFTFTAETYTFSCYAKLGVGSRGIQLRVRTAIGSGTIYANSSFNLSTGAVIGTPTGIPVATDVGNGWWRLSVSFAAAAGSIEAGILLCDASGNAIFNGDNASGNYIWGAQLNVGALQPYYPTTVKNLLGYTQEFDNAAWTKSNSFVQTNQIRNNTMQGAVAGTPGTLPTNWATAGSGAGTLVREIVGSGVVDGINYIDIRYSGTTSTTGFSISSEPQTGGVVAFSGQTWTASTYVAIVGGSTNNISILRANAMIGRTSVGGSSLDAANSGDNKAALTNNLQRFTSTMTLADAATVSIQPVTTIGFNSGVAIDITLRIGLPQLVQGATAGNVVATYGTARAVMYAAPNGSMTADKLVENTAASTGHFVTTSTTFSATQVVTFSAYAKAAERSFFQLVVTGVGPAGLNVVAGFDLALGTAGAPNYGTSSVDAVGSGWFRCSYTIPIATGTLATLQARLALNSAGVVSSYTGDGTSGIYIWGAQLSDSASLDPYVYQPVAAPASTAYYGPRFDYDPVTLAPKGLLIEEQRTNSIRNNTMVGAVAGSPGTLPTNWAFIAGSTGISSQVIGTGVEAGVPYIDVRYSGTATSTSSFSQRFEVGNVIAALTGQTWAMSTWAKIQAGSTAGITAINHQYVENTSAGSFVTSGSILITVDSSLTRQTSSRTLTGGATVAFLSGGISVTVTNGAAIDITLRIGLPQLEQGAFATSPIPTTTAAATRAADVATMIGANFSNWYNQSEGTLFGEFTRPAAITASYSGGFPRVAEISDGTTSNNLRLSGFAPSQEGFAVAVSGADVCALVFTQPASGTITKLAGAYKLNDFAASMNGSAAVNDTAGAIPAVSVMYIGNRSDGTRNMNGNIRRIAFYPRRLANSELQSITA